MGTFKNLDVDFTYSVVGEVHNVHIGGAIEPFAFARLGGLAPTCGLDANTTEGVLEIPVPDTFLDLQYSCGTSSYASGAFLSPY